MKFAAALLLWCGMALAFSAVPAAPKASGIDSAEQLLFTLTNRKRATLGLPALKWDPRLQAAARLHAADMAGRNYFDHISDKAGHQTPADRVHKAGVLDNHIGENLAYNNTINLTRATKQLMTQWINSPPHYAAIKSKEFTHIGIGVYRGKNGNLYGVQNFAERQVEVLANSKRTTAQVRQLRLVGQVMEHASTVELALFSGKQYMGMVPTDSFGGFSITLEYQPNQPLELGWRTLGDQGPFTVSAKVLQPVTFGKGSLNVEYSSEVVNLNAMLEGSVQEMFVLDLRFKGGTKALVLLEGDVRRSINNRAITVRCAVGTTRKPLQVVYGSLITHTFTLDCATGMLEAGAQK